MHPHGSKYHPRNRYRKMNTKRALLRNMAFLELAALALLIIASHALGEESARPYHLVCFEKSAIIKSLNRVKTIEQYLNFDEKLRNNSCTFVQIPKGSAARFDGFHENPNGLIFSLFQVKYSTSGQRMYLVDGIFAKSDWTVIANCNDCEDGPGETCLAPRNCSVLDEYSSRLGKNIPDFIKLPKQCRIYYIE